MPRPKSLRKSKLRDRDDETNNQIGAWSRERLIKMDRAYCAAVERVLTASENSTRRGYGADMKTKERVVPS
jgi:hypothetical protein